MKRPNFVWCHYVPVMHLKGLTCKSMQCETGPLIFHAHIHPYLCAFPICLRRRSHGVDLHAFASDLRKKGKKSIFFQRTA